MVVVVNLIIISRDYIIFRLVFRDMAIFVRLCVLFSDFSFCIMVMVDF